MNEHQFTQVIKGNQVRYEKPCSELCKALGVSERQAQRYISNLGNVKMKDFLIIVRELHIQEEDLISYLKK